MSVDKPKQKMSAARSMVTVKEAQAKAAKYFERHYRNWVADAFRQAISVHKGALPSMCPRTNEISLATSPSTPTLIPQPTSPSTPSLTPKSTSTFSLPLHPPTEQQVLTDGSSARDWVQSWRSSPYASSLQWIIKEWKSVGRQEVPERLVLSEGDEVAAFAGQQSKWRCVLQRTLELAENWSTRWNERCPQCDDCDLINAVQRSVPKYGTLDNHNWNMLVSMLDWLLENQEVKQYVRQLPVRGIDSKWLETNKAVIEPLYAAMTGKVGFEFLSIPSQIRVRFLDPTLAPGGLRDISLSPEEFKGYSLRPQAVLVCENLVSVMALPSMPGTIAIHGSGYAVAALAEVTWLSQVPMYYWGDLDSNGFAILNRLRHHFPAAVSVMMDPFTLEQHRDLCVVEGSPSRGTLSHLTDSERQALGILLSGKEALRLEQERIEWHYALDQIIQHMKN